MSTLWPATDNSPVGYISRPPSKAWQEERPRRLVILGSTGSIGRNALNTVQALPGFFSVQGLACARNVALLAQQANLLRPPYLAVLDNAARDALVALLPDNYRPEILMGSAGYASLAALPEATTVLSAQVGAAGLAGTLAAALAGKVICLANKESLVQAGSLVRDICARTGASILPVDSEHFALFQCLAGRGRDVANLVLTASGGPFRGRTAAGLANVTPADALRHPNWQMGAKITIDSATMMNKGLEVIEAYHLYGVTQEHIRVQVHPQSIVHSLVQFVDGSLLAQMGTPDMRLPIASCLAWPEVHDVQVPQLDLAQAASLTFHEPDMENFPCLALAWEALRQRGGMCVVLNAANEAAVELFLQGKIAFMDIPRLIRAAMQAHRATGQAVGTPFCPPLAGGTSADALATEVWALADRIGALDKKSRALVHDLAGQKT